MYRQRYDYQPQPYVQPQQQTDWAAYHKQQADGERAQLQQTVGGQRGAKREKFGTADGLRDATGNVRDVQYNGGDANYRTFGYDSNNQLNHMVVESKSKGVQVWDRVGHNTWFEKNSKTTLQAEMTVDQKTGEFSYRGRDGVTQTYDGKQFRPNNGLDKANYDQLVDKTFGKERCITNKENYKNNLYDAAEAKREDGKTGKPVVMTFGRGSDPACKSHLEALSAAKKASGGKAEFMFIDLDKVDPKSKVGEYARDYIGKDYGTPLTMVFTQSQGENGKGVAPDRPMHWQQGSLNEERLLSGINEAARLQAQKAEIKTGRDTKKEGEGTDSGAKPAQPKPEDLLKEAAKPWKDQHPEQLMKNMTVDERKAFVKAAVEQADKMNNPKLSAQIRASVGFAEISWGAEAKKQGKLDEAEAHFLRGSEYMMSAGVHNKDIYRYPGFTEKFRNSELPGTAADSVIERGLKDPKWFFPTAEQEKDNPNAFRDARLDPVKGYYKFLKDEFKKPKPSAPNDSYRDYGPSRRDRIATV